MIVDSGLELGMFCTVVPLAMLDSNIINCYTQEKWTHQIQPHAAIPLRG